MSISETKYFCGAGIFVVDSGENRGIIVQTSKAATKTGAQASRPRERPLVLRGSCRERTAPPLPSRPPERFISSSYASPGKGTTVRGTVVDFIASATAMLA